MTDAPAAISASYADYRRVKGRKVLQLILEVPLELAPQVHEAFGEPLPDGTTWVGVARIDPTATPERKGGKLAQRAGILCGEAGFHHYLEERGYHVKNMDVQAAEAAADIVRGICGGIISRSEIDHNPEAGRKFLDLATSYEAWKTL